MNRLLLLLASFAMMLFLASPVTAQQLYVHGGAGFPSSSDFKDAYNAGYNLGIGLGYDITPMVEGVVRGSYDRFGLDNDFDTGSFDPGDFSSYSATGNLKVKAPMQNRRFTPYALGGGGVFSLGIEDDRETKLGLQFGAGVDIRMTGRANLMIEPNYVVVFTENENMQYFPVRIGASVGLR